MDISGFVGVAVGRLRKCGTAGGVEVAELTREAAEILCGTAVRVDGV